MRDLVEEILKTLGPDVGLPALRSFIPDAPRAALERHLRRYRLHHRRRRRARLQVLTWKRAGAVWALDLAEPPKPVDGWGRRILSIRDLASGYSLMWMPLKNGSTKEVVEPVNRLFRRTGAPLILKSDNGSAFLSRHFRMLLARNGVVHLRSPRAWPQYNGACEAGIGVLRELTTFIAAGDGRQDRWTLEDLEEARERVNSLPRYRGKQLESSRRKWEGRHPITPFLRRRLRKTISRVYADLVQSEPAASKSRLRLRRRAIQEALMRIGILEVRRTWIKARLRGPTKYPSYR